MALLQKIDYYGLSSSGFEVTDTNENRSVGYTATAQGDNGFTVAVCVPEEQIIAPQVNYIVTGNATLSTVVLGSTRTILGKTLALGGVTINTQAGSPVTMTATGSQIEDNGSAKCTCTLGGISLSPLYHAQDFGLFSVGNGQLTQSTLNITGNIATALVDGVIKSSDLVGGQIEVQGTVVGVNDDGEISTPSISFTTPSGNVLSGVVTQPLTQTNPNGDYPTYSFAITYPLKADS